MKHWMEDWVEENHLNGEAKAAYREAFIAFKGGAYRAALVFSYIGFIMCIRSRLNTAKPPGNYEEQNWRNKIRAMNDERYSDTKTFDLINASDKSNRVFDISDQLRKEVEYWKNRRNDAAHWKSNEIRSCHVESFWYFLKSNMSKLMPEGSKEYTVGRWIAYWDEAKQTEKENVSLLVNRTLEAIELTEVDEFLTMLKKEVHEVELDIDRNLIGDGDAIAEILDNLLTKKSWNEQIVEWLLGEEGDMVDLLTAHPKHLSLFYENALGPRNDRWLGRLFPQTGRHSRNDLKVFAALLKSDWLKPEQKEQILERAVENSGVYHQDDIFEKEFYPKFDERMKTERKFVWLNQNAKLFVARVKHHFNTTRPEWLMDTLLAIFCEQDTPYTLAPMMKEYFREANESFTAFKMAAGVKSKEISVSVDPSLEVW